MLPTIALVVVLLLARPRGAQASFFGSIGNWFDRVFGGDPPSSARAETLSSWHALFCPQNLAAPSSILAARTSQADISCLCFQDKAHQDTALIVFTGSKQSVDKRDVPSQRRLFRYRPLPRSLWAGACLRLSMHQVRLTALLYACGSGRDAWHCVVRQLAAVNGLLCAADIIVILRRPGTGSRHHVPCAGTRRCRACRHHPDRAADRPSHVAPTAAPAAASHSAARLGPGAACAGAKLCHASGSSTLSRWAGRCRPARPAAAARRGASAGCNAATGHPRCHPVRCASVISSACTHHSAGLSQRRLSAACCRHADRVKPGAIRPITTGAVEQRLCQ